MTVPGPQQPDEVRAKVAALLADSEPANYEENDYAAGRQHALAEVLELLPAAPSAQPDEETCTSALHPLGEFVDEVEPDCPQHGTPTPPPSLSQQRRRAEQDGAGCKCGHEQSAHGRIYDEPGTLGYGPCDDCRCRCFSSTPAQPVRDTGEGRR